MNEKNLLTRVGPMEINQVFATLHLIYPAFMKGMSEEEEQQARRLWLRALSSCSVKAVTAALDMTPDRFPSFCPKLGEFKSLCRLAPAPKDYSMLRLSDLSRSEPTAKGQEAIAALKGLVKGGKVND